MYNKNQKKKKLFTFFIDLRKAYDSVTRNILWQKLYDTNIADDLFKAIKSMTM